MSAANLDLAHHNMIEQQIRPWDVLDDKVLNLLNKLPRDAFVSAKYKNLAYADTGIPLGNGHEMMHPILEGRMLQELDIQKEDDILEIGTGSGYITACLASLGDHVTSIEIEESLSELAGQHLVELGILNIDLLVDDASSPGEIPKRYDVIAITGSVPALPEEYKNALTLGGRMFVIIGEDPVMRAYLITRTGEDSWSQQRLFDTSVKALTNAEKGPQFVF